MNSRDDGTTQLQSLIVNPLLSLILSRYVKFTDHAKIMHQVQHSLSAGMNKKLS